ncbi:trehalose-phosphatase [Bacteroidota bacterium]
MTDKIKAAIFDLDGVITSTASTHSTAWKQMFDEYNERRKNEGKDPYQPFTIEIDYINYVDGKPRYMGVKDFLSSRKIILPFGDPGDPPDAETICGLGNRKNNIFLGIVEKEGAEVLDKNVEKAKKWKSMGIKLGIVSSSKNCEMILKAVHLDDLFETMIDGIISAERGYNGKPAPDIFVKAAEELGVAPSESLIVEDALVGVEAGKNGNFGLVIGIADENKAEMMLKHGADIVVDTLERMPKNPIPIRQPGQLSSALEDFKEILQECKGKKLFLFLDYDGTLTPIVEDFNAAFLSEDMRNLVKEISESCPMAIITGRDIKDIKDLVKIDQIHYAGSHGFDMVGPDGFIFENEQANESRRTITEVSEEIRDKTAHIQGVKLEYKKYAIAVHYRQVSDNQQKDAKEIVYDIISQYPEIRPGKGKKVIEMKPNFDWHKGKSIRVLLDRMIGKDQGDNFLIYIGDDITDEDAFFEVLDDGIGILVGDHGRKTFASSHLRDVDEVKLFLQRILDDLKA